MAQNPSYVSMVSDPNSAKSHPAMSSPVPLAPAMLPTAKRAESSLVDALRFSRFTVSPALEPHLSPSCDAELGPTAGKWAERCVGLRVTLPGEVHWVRKEDLDLGKFTSFLCMNLYEQVK